MYQKMMIPIDHGNRNMKTEQFIFTSGLVESDSRPALGEYLYYDGRYYALTEQRIPYMRDKTADDRFFILTLFGIAMEAERQAFCKEDTILQVSLPVGLPPKHYGALYQKFQKYFSGRGRQSFTYKGKAYTIEIEQVSAFPQDYAAAMTIYPKISEFNKVVTVDIGGFTADYLMMRSGRADLAVCDSLENGVIVLYNQIRTKANSEFDILLDETDIDSILGGKSGIYAPEVSALVERMAQGFVNDLTNGLRERMLDLSSGRVVFVGGGAVLLRRQIENSGKVRNALFVEDVSANAKGYEFLYRMETAGR